MQNTKAAVAQDVSGSPRASRSSNGNREWMYIWLSFSFAYSWFNVHFYNGTHNALSPLVPFVTALGADPTAYLAAVYIPLVVATGICFFFMKDASLSSYRPLWCAVHVLLFICIALLPFISSRAVFYVVCGVAGALCGVVFYRIFFAMFLFFPTIGWVRMFVITLVSLRVGVHLFSLLPPTEYLYPMYGVSLLMLATTIVLSLTFRGNVLKARMAMSKTQLKVRPLIPFFIFMGGVQVFIAALKVFVEPEIEQDTLSLWLDVASSVVSLGLLWFFGTRIKKKETFLRMFFVLMMLAFASHQVFGLQGELLTIQFMEPAYLCWDVFLYSMIVCLFINYGRQQMQLRIVLLFLFFSLIFGQTVLIFLFQNMALQNFFYNGFLYVAAFVLFMVAPQVIKKAGLTEIVEDELTPHIVRGDVLLHAENERQSASPELTVQALIVLLLPQERLTEREEEVLEQLIQGQDTEAIAYTFHISVNTVRFHIKNICAKFGVNSKAELLKLRGEALDSRERAAQTHENAAEKSAGYSGAGLLRGSLERPAERATTIVLTKREQDVLHLFMQGMDNDAIAENLYIAASTVRFHTHNICRKCGVNSREELQDYLNSRERV